MSQLITVDPWHMVLAKPTPIMIIGRPSTIRPFLEELEPWLSEPVLHVICDKAVPHAGLPLEGTAVLHDIDRVGIESQRDLMGWFEVFGRTTRVVSVSSRPLLPLIASQQFLERLYYRLNAVYVELSMLPASANRAQHGSTTRAGQRASSTVAVSAAPATHVTEAPGADEA